jgi:hypothetical protein
MTTRYSGSIRQVSRSRRAWAVACVVLAACGGAAPSSDPSAATSLLPVIPPPAAAAAGRAATAQPGTAGAAAVAPSSTGAVPPPTAATAATTPPATASTATSAETDKLWCGVKKTLDARCTACHNPQKTAGAPMSLKTHADLIAPAVSDPTKKVYEVVGTRTHDQQRPMPPQGVLDAPELGPLDSWIAAGAPAGSDPTCAANGPEVQPTEQVWPENCDATYKVYAANGAAPNSIGAGAETHPQFMVTPPWGNEEAQAIAWRALTDNAKVLHHWILYGPTGEFLFGWAPGKDNNEPLPSDTGMYLPSGTMRMDVHYNNVTGSSMEMDKSGVEICVLERANFRPKTASVTNRLASRLINIPARAVDYDVTGTCAHSGAPVNLLSVSPHAHRTAKHMKFTVEKANGMTIVMHDKDFNFEEQTTYALDPPIVVESGDKVITTCTFTNDTDRTITFGENTGNEMCFNFAITEPMNGLSCGGFGL